MLSSVKRVLPLVAALGTIASFAVQPAFADDYAFGYSYYDGNESLTVNGGAPISTNGVQGWVSPAAPTNEAGPDSNTNYIVGTCCGNNVYSDFFVFNVSGVTGSVTSAALTINPFTITTDFTYVLHDATAYAGLLPDAVSPDPALYADLAQGPILGSFSVTTAQSNGPLLTFTLNSTGLSDLNTVIADGGSTFAISGTVAGQAGSTGGVPEPAAWALMLVGFAGLGVTLRSRRKTAVAA